MNNDDPNRPETEGQAATVQDRRRYRRLQGLKAQRGQTSAAVQLATPSATEPENSQEQTEEREAYSRMSELLKRRREG